MWLQSIIGISVVFIALIALYFFISMFGKVMGIKLKRKKTTEITDIKTTNDIESDAELIAVITAAIHVALVKTGISPECKIRVKTFKRITTDSPIWNKVGRNELIN